MDSYTPTLLKRWDEFNAFRIERALSVMNPQSQKIFHLLPALLHLNQPDLPGYVRGAPSGVFRFELNEIQQKLLQTLEVKINSTRNKSTPKILAIFSMGSTSSMGQSYSSDIDLWVCISPQMPDTERKKLKKKCSLISEWSQNKGVNVDFFLMDKHRFRNNISEKLTNEDCGSAQHLILLDEFYRSAVRIAGQRLLWRIVPPEMESCYDQYLARLYDSKQLDKEEWMDFGQLYRIPAEEYFGASLWQLYKSIDSPYKSVLKAILLESYTWEYPYPRLLSLEGKRRFFSCQPDESGMDSYYLMLEKVSRYLIWTGDEKRLDLVRRCFYLKTHEKLSREKDSQRVQWRYSLLQKLVKEWGWSKKKLKHLDDRGQWKIESVKVMHQDLLDALMASYRNLIRFAEQHKINATISPEDISILSRKLYASFESLPNKVTLFNTQISSNLSEPFLSFIQVAKGRNINQGWYLYKAPLDPQAMMGQKAIKHHSSLSKLVVWAFFNGLITEKTVIDALIQRDYLPINKLHQMVNDLRSCFDIVRPSPTVEALNSPCEITKIAIFINLESDPTTKLHKKEISSLTKQFKNNPEHCHVISSVDVVYSNSWQELWTLHFEGDSAVIDMLKKLLSKMHPNSLPPKSVNVFCYSQHLNKQIKDKVSHIVKDCIKLRLRPFEKKHHRRFKFLRMATGMYGLFFEDRGVSVMKLENPIEFYSNISNNKLHGTPLRVVNKEQTLLPQPIVINGFASEGFVQLFFEDDEDGFNIYVLDEENKIEVYRQLDGTKEDIIYNMNRFYTRLKTSKNDKDIRHFNLPQYYQVFHDNNGESYVTPYRRQCD